MAGDLIQASSDKHVGHFFKDYIKKDPDALCQVQAAFVFSMDLLTHAIKKIGRYVTVSSYDI
jgi:hypothetical protein